MSSKKHQRPGHAHADDNRMKVHLRLVKLDGVTYRVITLRPGTQVAFSTNYFHETWHILSDAAGAKLLARLLWGLAFQKLPGTMVVIHGEHLKPTPFDGDASDPIALIPAHLTHLSGKALQTLKHSLRCFGLPDQTVRWQTFGLDEALGNKNWQESENWSKPCWTEHKALERQEKMYRRSGFICYQAPPTILRESAFAIYRLDPRRYGMDYAELVRSFGYGFDGEVQIFSDYHQRLAAAIVARREISPVIASSTLPELRRDIIQQHCLTVQKRRAQTRL